jgi:hypothetical protein
VTPTSEEFYAGTVAGSTATSEGMVRSATATPAAANPAITQKPSEYPAVNAAACDWPVCSKDLAWVKATLPAIATPCAPPTCWDVLSKPEACAASLDPTPGQRCDRHRHETHGQTHPNQEVSGQQVRDKLSADRYLRIKQHAPGEQRHPDHQDWPNPEPGTQRLRDAGDDDGRARRGQECEAGAQGRIVQHVLHVEGQQIEIGKYHRAQKNRHGVGAGQRPDPEDA